MRWSLRDAFDAIKRWGRRVPHSSSFTASARKGKEGEDAAQKYLRQQGYRILGRNVVVHPYEIDIVAEKDDVIIFVEVRTRKPGAWVHPALSVGRAKQRSLRTAAAGYRKFHRLHDRNYRFDIIAVWMDAEGQAKLEHITNAFT